MPDAAASSRRRLTVVLLIFLLPLVPAAIVQVLVRRSPPGESISPLMSEVIAAMQLLPKPAADAPPLDLATPLEVGDRFVFAISRDCRLPDGTDTRREVAYRLVAESALEQGVVASLVPLGDAPPLLGRDPLRFRWDRDGFVEAEVGRPEIVGDLRDLLLMRHGLVLPGPYPKAVRENEWLAPPGRESGPEATALITAAGLVRGSEEMPHRGGIMPQALTASSRYFRLLGYRRHALEQSAASGGDDRRVGFCERVLRGYLECPDRDLAPSLAEFRITEHLRFAAGERQLDGDVVCRIRQTIRRDDQESDR
ncbi:MAG: hypothetical protein H6807_10915 [Planctomycetes bacterium]|nr:hypothetical protein [Planctomycetota bacterium]